MDDNITSSESSTAITTTATATEKTTSSTAELNTISAKGSPPPILPIAVGVTCTVLALVILLIIVFCLRKKRKERARRLRGSALPDPNLIDRVNQGFDDQSENVDPIRVRSLPTPPNGVPSPGTSRMDDLTSTSPVQVTPGEGGKGRKASQPGYVAQRDRHLDSIQVLPPSPAPHLHGAPGYVNTGPDSRKENPELDLLENAGGTLATRPKMPLSSLVMAPAPAPHQSMANRSYVNTGKDKALHNPELTPPRPAKRDYVNVSEWVERTPTKRVPSVAPPEEHNDGANLEQLPVYDNA